MRNYIKDYPRPQMVRHNWKNLNGSWDFAFDDNNMGQEKNWSVNFPKEHRTIQVPFTYETKKSGIYETGHHENIWYSRSVMLEEKEIDGKKILLHFEGSDFKTIVWINGKAVGSHQGGYARFSFDITRYVSPGENRITVKVEDSKSIVQPRGKQRWMENNFGCWYVQTTGIWKTVWLEYVNPVHLKAVKITPDLEAAAVNFIYDLVPEVCAGTYMIETIVSYEGTDISRSCRQIQRTYAEDQISLYAPWESPWGLHLWTPDDPALYEVVIRIYTEHEIVDEVCSYFGMRDIQISNGNILLNGTPLYQRLILDQGYWADSHLTPPDEAALIEDIEKIQSMGYNGVRKHMKTEDERFLYWCDVKGLLVWSEMAACYEFNDAAVQEFTKEWMDVVRQNYNHPSIITWTPFNESWGIHQIKTDEKQQAFTQSIYYLTKSFDGMRPVIVNDGWEHTVSDILTLHDYEEDGAAFYERYADHLQDIIAGRLYPNKSKAALADGFTYRGQPVIISEYGGIAFSGGEEGAWGYGKTVSDEAEFLERFDRITTAIKRIPYVVGYCYTQVSDVQQEINGLLDEKHGYKLEPEKIREINCREVLPPVCQTAAAVPDNTQ
ncbi:MAG: glycoside hydrolase family 2 protein [Catenibacillus sp.]